MYYKILKDGKIIDVLDRIVYCKYQIKHDVVLLCKSNEAELFLSSDENYAWHDYSLRRLPTEVTKYETVERIEITEQEYETIKHLSLKNK